jgi:hypothetical protein
MSVLSKIFVTLFILWGCLVAYNAKADDVKSNVRPAQEETKFSVQCVPVAGVERCSGNTEALRCL